MVQCIRKALQKSNTKMPTCCRWLANSGKSDSQVPNRRFDQTAAITPQDRAQAVGKIVSTAQEHKLTTAGIFSTGESVEGIFNSRGLSDWHTHTSSEISITMLAPDSSGWQTIIRPTLAFSTPLLWPTSPRENIRLCQTERNTRRQVHRHSRTCRSARHGGIHVLGFRRACHPRSKIFSQ